MRSAAYWLVRSQDADGCWRNPNPFVTDAGEDRVFVTQVAWGLFEATRQDAAVPWVCLTDSVQIAHCWLLLLDRETGEEKFRDAAFAANAFVRRTMHTEGPPEVAGGVKGSFPVSGGCGRFQHLNWACKFMDRLLHA